MDARLRKMDRYLYSMEISLSLEIVRVMTNKIILDPLEYKFLGPPDERDVSRDSINLVDDRIKLVSD